MRYPALAPALVAEHLEELLVGGTGIGDHASLTGDGQEVDLAKLDDAIEVISRALQDRLAASPTDLDDDQFEGKMAGVLHEALKDMDVGMLDDPGFWAYLACGP